MVIKNGRNTIKIIVLQEPETFLKKHGKWQSYSRPPMKTIKKKPQFLRPLRVEVKNGNNEKINSFVLQEPRIILTRNLLKN